MSNKTKLLIVSSEFPPEPGGIGNHAYNLADHLSLHTFEVTVLTNQRNSNSSVEKSFDREKRFTTIRIKSVRYKILLYVNRILKILNYCKMKNILYFVADQRPQNSRYIENICNLPILQMCNGYHKFFMIL